MAVRGHQAFPHPTMAPFARGGGAQVVPVAAALLELPVAALWIIIISLMTLCLPKIALWLTKYLQTHTLQHTPQTLKPCCAKT